MQTVRAAATAWVLACVAAAMPVTAQAATSTSRGPQGPKTTIGAPGPFNFAAPELYLPTKLVRRGPDAGVTPLPRATQDIGSLTYTHEGHTRDLRRFMSRTETDALLVLRNGVLVGELYNNGYRPAQRHQIWSVTKSFVSTLIGIAWDEGRIGSLDDPIERYVPALRRTAWEGVTLRNLLLMRSGIVWSDSAEQVYQLIDMTLDRWTKGRAGKDRDEFLSRLRRVAPQGTEFHYNSGNTQVLGWALEQIYRRPLSETLSEKIWKPLGMEGDARLLTDRLGNAIASQSLYVLPYDLARFGLMMANGGRTPDGRQIVSEAWVRQAARELVAYDTDGERFGYGFQWWNNVADPAGFSGQGFQGNSLFVSPTSCTVVVRLSYAFETVFQLADPFFEIDYGSGDSDAVVAALNTAVGGCS
ncbi:MAG: serine hydrolase domain-containing protein [Baekduiaceae bacterium]